MLREVLGGDELEVLSRGVERNLADLGPLAINATRPGEPGAFIEDFRNWQRISEYERVILESSLGRVAGELMGSEQVRLFHDHLLVKEAGTLDRSPWHQDQPYYCIEGTQTVSFWIPLDPVKRPSALVRRRTRLGRSALLSRDLPSMDVTMLLCEAAEHRAANSLCWVGAGLSFAADVPTPIALAIKISVPGTTRLGPTTSRRTPPCGRRRRSASGRAEPSGGPAPRSKSSARPGNPGAPLAIRCCPDLGARVRLGARSGRDVVRERPSRF